MNMMAAVGPQPASRKNLLFNPLQAWDYPASYRQAMDIGL